MTAARLPPFRRIWSVLVWTLGLLLVTNVTWSVWFAFSTARSGIGGSEVGRDTQPTGRDVAVNYWRTKREYTVAEPTDPNWSYAVSGTFEQVAPSWLRTEYLRRRDRSLDSDGEIRLNFGVVGWPVPLLWTVSELKYNNYGDGHFATVPTTGLNIGRVGSLKEGDEIVFPFRPLWTGQVFYSAFCLGVVLLVPMTRRHLRMRRGRCAACNYDLRATTTGTCPECGAAIAPRATT